LCHNSKNTTLVPYTLILNKHRKTVSKTAGNPVEIRTYYTQNPNQRYVVRLE